MTKRKHVLVTAGPTREMIDPVRFISNIATGELGYAIARQAKRRGHRVTLLSGPTPLKVPPGIRTVYFSSNLDLERALRKHFPGCDVLIMSAAVCDFHASFIKHSKIKRRTSHALYLKRTKDLLKEFGRKKGRRMVIGFSLETENLVKNSIKKLKEKNLDYVVANVYDRTNNPFGPRMTRAAIIGKDRKALHLPRLPKDKIARHIVRLLG